MSKPKHYQTESGLDVIDFCKQYDLNFNLGNVVKYLARAGKKGSKIEDLEKALDYIQRELKAEHKKSGTHGLFLYSKFAEGQEADEMYNAVRKAIQSVCESQNRCARLDVTKDGQTTSKVFDPEEFCWNNVDDLKTITKDMLACPEPKYIHEVTLKPNPNAVKDFFEDHPYLKFENLRIKTDSQCKIPDDCHLLVPCDCQQEQPKAEKPTMLEEVLTAIRKAPETVPHELVMSPSAFSAMCDCIPSAETTPPELHHIPLLIDHTMKPDTFVVQSISSETLE